MRLAVLGGSSPFTVGLINALAACQSLAPGHLVLFGRNKDNLDLLCKYGRNSLSTLGWYVNSSIDIAEALQEVDIVLHQIRYGGFEGRASDEAFAHQWELPSDETLGPAAFHSMIRMLPILRKFSTMLNEACPEAWVLNLTNPLSLVTALMIDAGINRCIGLCELPLFTARHAAERLGLPFEEVDWSYVGLNHRGFIVRLNYHGTDFIEEYIYRFSKDILRDVPTTILSHLGAIPTKYFGLLFNTTKISYSSRARFLSRLREQITDELQRDTNNSPSSFEKRPTEWYSHAVIPILVALSSLKPVLQVVNLLFTQGIVEERMVQISKTTMNVFPQPQVTEPVGYWLQMFISHESAQLQAMRSPSLETFSEAVHRDPLIPAVSATAITQALWDKYRMHQNRVSDP